ncbi:MAG: ATP-binding protein [Desulfovibrio sp.]|nr:ATP-binding protein [Desulfovibrio sp.]
MRQTLSPLPVGEQDFANLRNDGSLYIDKTAFLQKLIEEGRWYFLSRPRRFGKSLTLSTLEAMFMGRTELFSGLAAEDWVAEQARHPSPVLYLDLSSWPAADAAETLPVWLIKELEACAYDHNIILNPAPSCAQTFSFLLRELAKAKGQVVVLIDEYDTPILKNLKYPEKANAIRAYLRDFYQILKNSSRYIRFALLTGITKFSKAGIFSALNNLRDISFATFFGAFLGYTQDEISTYFNGYIDSLLASKKYGSKDILLNKIKEYYDGYSFDGETKVYNPFSILNFFYYHEFKNYWYASGEPEYLADYLKKYGIDNPEIYRNYVVDQLFTETADIERAQPESFLYQSGYLTIVSKDADTLTLDYPNREVLNSLAELYLKSVYTIPMYKALTKKLQEALALNNFHEVITIYNSELAALPYSDFQNAGEGIYRTAFLLLIRAANFFVKTEDPSKKGRADLVIETQKDIYVLEFKIARTEKEITKKISEGFEQFAKKEYLKPYETENRSVKAYVIVIDRTKHTALAYDTKTAIYC